MSKFKTEAEVGEVVMAYLAGPGVEVYSEVQLGDIRIDIVAVSGHLVTAVELKARLSLDVLGQAADRSGYVHRSIAAFPMPKERRYKQHVLGAVNRATGIGIWQVMDSGDIHELFAPRLLRRPCIHIVRAALHPGQKHQAAGVPHGQWSVFKQTTMELIRFVANNPGCSLKQAIDGIKHHYGSSSTARSSIYTWLRKGVITEIELRDGGLYLKEVK